MKIFFEFQIWRNLFKKTQQLFSSVLGLGSVVGRRIWNLGVPGSILSHSTYLVSLSKAPCTHQLISTGLSLRIAKPAQENISRSLQGV